MKRFLVTVIVVIFVMSIHNAHADESTKDFSIKIEDSAEQSNDKVESVKHKRGIVSGYGYPVPNVGITYQKHSPYARFPGIHRGLTGSYALTPGTASVQSYSVTYPRAIYSKPPVAHPHVVYHSHPRTYYPTVYANRYPFIPSKPVSFVPTPTFAAAPAFVPHSHAHVHPVIATNPFAVQPQFIPNALPASAPSPAVFPHQQVPTLISQNGWRPVIQSAPVPQLPVYPQASIPQTPIVPHVPQIPQVNRPSISVLPPLAAAGSGNTPNVNSFYLPPRHAGSTHINEHAYSNDELVQADEQFYHQQQQQQQQQQQDLQAHLQHLEQNQNYFRNQNNEGHVVPLSEQGYETASNNGRYSGLSSYDVPLNHRGRLARRSA